MKKVTLLFLLLQVSLSSFTQALKPFSLNDFVGKKIVSTYESSAIIKMSFPGINAAPSQQEQKIARSMVIKDNKDGLEVDKVLSKIHISMENMVTLEVNEYDSEKKFDRPMEVSMVYGKYDKFINKPFRMLYNKQGKRIDTLSNFKEDNYYYDGAWGDDMLPYLQKEWLGIFQLSQPTGDWKVGQTWQQILPKKDGGTTKNGTITNTYTVKSIDNNIVLLEVKGVDIPEQVMYKRSDGFVNNTLKDTKTVTANKNINYTVEQKSDYEGTIQVDSRTNLILKMVINTNNLKRILVKDSPPSGPESSYQVTIENRVEDLK